MEVQGYANRATIEAIDLKKSDPTRLPEYSGVVTPVSYPLSHSPQSLGLSTMNKTLVSNALGIPSIIVPNTFLSSLKPTSTPGATGPSSGIGKNRRTPSKPSQHESEDQHGLWEDDLFLYETGKPKIRRSLYFQKRPTLLGSMPTSQTFSGRRLRMIIFSMKEKTSGPASHVRANDLLDRDTSKPWAGSFGGCLLGVGGQ